jgi:hypothetical protein
MDKEHIAVYLPTPLIAQVDTLAHSELRSRANTVRLLVTEGLRSREVGAQDEGSRDD